MQRPTGFVRTLYVLFDFLVSVVFKTLRNHGCAVKARLFARAACFLGRIDYGL
jgi:hypothetical protein